MRHTQTVDQLVIKPQRQPNSTNYASARIFSDCFSLPCKIGHGGIGIKNAEGDGVTPFGDWKLAYYLYRKDRIKKPVSLLPGFPVKLNDSWCDMATSKRYNQPLGFPMPGTSEALWRNDNLYNLIVVLDHNSLPFIKGRGSAIFIHVAEPSTSHTQGCIALTHSDLLKLLAICKPQTRILIRS